MSGWARGEMHCRAYDVLLEQYSNAVESFSLAVRGYRTDRKARVGPAAEALGARQIQPAGPGNGMTFAPERKP